MSRAPALLCALALALALPACHTAQPTPQRFARVRVHMKGNQNQVLEQIRSDATARGWRVDFEAPDAIGVDFGVQEMRIPVPTEYGLWGTRVSFRNTEVHSSAIYQVSPVSDGAVVTLWNNPIYWHPDYKVWLPGPYDIAPGRDLLRETAAK